jgi:A/G-specific adenine glycosylase
MDLGATICTPRQPACALCPWNTACAAGARGDAETYPRKTRARTGPLRRGAAFVVRRADGAVLLRTRAATGLLAGMSEVPTTDWMPQFDEDSALTHAPKLTGVRSEAINWLRIPGLVAHTFTHFPLELVVFAAEVPASAKPPRGTRWSVAGDLPGEALPSVMRKVLAHALGR